MISQNPAFTPHFFTANPQTKHFPDICTYHILSFLKAKDLFNLETCSKKPIGSSIVLDRIWKEFRQQDHYTGDWSDTDRNPHLHKEKMNYWFNGVISWYLSVKKAANSIEKTFPLAAKISSSFGHLIQFPHFHFFMTNEMISLRSSKNIADQPGKDSLLLTALSKTYGGDILLQGLMVKDSNLFIQYMKWAVEAHITYSSLLVIDYFHPHALAADQETIKKIILTSNIQGDSRALKKMQIQYPDFIREKELAMALNQVNPSKKRKIDKTIKDDEESSKKINAGQPSNFKKLESNHQLLNTTMTKILNFLSVTDLFNFEKISKNPISPFSNSLLELRWKYLRHVNYYHGNWFDATINLNKQERTNYWLHTAFAWYLKQYLSTDSAAKKIDLGAKIARFFMPLKHLPHFNYFMKQQMVNLTSSNTCNDSNQQFSLFKTTEKEQFGGDIFLQAWLEYHGNFDMFIEYIKRAIRADVTWAVFVIEALAQIRYINRQIINNFAVEAAKRSDFRFLEIQINNFSYKDFLQWKKTYQRNYPCVLYRTQKSKKNLKQKDFLLTLAIKSYRQRHLNFDSTMTLTDAPPYVLKAAACIKAKLTRIEANFKTV